VCTFQFVCVYLFELVCVRARAHACACVSVRPGKEFVLLSDKVYEVIQLYSN